MPVQSVVISFFCFFLQNKQNIDPVHYMTEWFLCVYVRTLPWETALRVWDMFLCEGVKVIIKVGLVLLKGCLGQKDITKQCPTMYETLELLRKPPDDLVEEEALIKQVNTILFLTFFSYNKFKHLIFIWCLSFGFQIQKLNVSEEEFIYEHKRQTKKMKSNSTNKSQN